MAYTLNVKVLRRKDSDAYEQVGSTKTFTGLTQEWRNTGYPKGSTVILWDTSASGNLADFDVLILYTDVEVEIEYTINEGDGNEELGSFRLAANVPFILGADDAYYNHSASDAFAGSLDVIDKIRVKESNSVQATVVLELHT